MTPVTRFFATCLLIISASVTAFAEGGETQGPGSPAPPQPGETQGPSAPANGEDPAANTSTLYAVVDAAGDFVAWFVNIF